MDCKIYKIEFLNYIYYGSTKQKYLSTRQARHNHNLKHNPKQKIYNVAKENNIEKLICELICECSEDDRLNKENEFIQDENDKIILNDRVAYSDIDRKREQKRRYEASEKGKHKRKLRESKFISD